MLKNNLVIHTKWEAEHIDLIEKTALEIWGDNITLGEIKDLGAFSFVKGFPMNLLEFVTYKTPKIIDNNHI